MKKLIILITILMLSGCAYFAQYQYNHNLTPEQNALLEMEFTRIKYDAWARRGPINQRYNNPNKHRPIRFK